MATQEGGTFAGVKTARRKKAKGSQKQSVDPPASPTVATPERAMQQPEPVTTAAPANQTRNTSSRGGKRSDPAWKSKGFLVRVETSNRLDLAIAKAKIAGEAIDQSELVDKLLSDWLEARGD